MPVSQAVFTGILCAGLAIWPAWDRGIAALDELLLTMYAMVGMLIAGPAAGRGESDARAAAWGAAVAAAMIVAATLTVNVVTVPPRVLLPPAWTLVRLAALCGLASMAAARTARIHMAVAWALYAAAVAVYLLSRGDLALDRLLWLAAAACLVTIRSWRPMARS